MSKALMNGTFYHRYSPELACQVQNKKSQIPIPFMLATECNPTIASCDGRDQDGVLSHGHRQALRDIKQDEREFYLVTLFMMEQHRKTEQQGKTLFLGGK